MVDGKKTMDYKKYIGLTQTDPVKAQEYKNSLIPEKLFKYVSLYNDPDKDGKRLASLKRGELYLGSFSEYNDPFEGTFLFIDEDKLTDIGWKEGVVSDIYRSLTDGRRICSLAGTSEQNLPMWAYYANNHRGYCIEYSFADEQKANIFPVAYEDKRPEATLQFADLLNDVTNVAFNNPDASPSEKIDQLTPESARAYVVIFLAMAAKHESWSHEREYRIIDLYNHDRFPAIPSKIYAGKDCSEENLKRLTDITKDYNKKGFPVELYKMKFDFNNKYCQLSEERIV